MLHGKRAMEDVSLQATRRLEGDHQTAYQADHLAAYNDFLGDNAAGGVRSPTTTRFPECRHDLAVDLQFTLRHEVAVDRQVSSDDRRSLD